jgi:uncharacterized protein YndB with AHSA1/START domain
MNETGSATTLSPVKKSIQVKLSVEAAFRLFTEGISKWWPLKTHSVGEEEAASCTFEGQVGGRIYETLRDGTQSEWGRVLAWDPPSSVSFSWYPGRADDTAGKVEVLFTAVPGGTRLDLVHSGWERLGERAPVLREGYVTGWDFVLGKFVEQAAA